MLCYYSVSCCWNYELIVVVAVCTRPAPPVQWALSPTQHWPQVPFAITQVYSTPQHLYQMIPHASTNKECRNMHLRISNCTHTAATCYFTPLAPPPLAPPFAAPCSFSSTPLQPPHTLSVTLYQSGAARNETAHTTPCTECAHTNSTTIRTV